MLSPPGRFSITTGLPQRCESFSWISRAPMSAPAPGPNGMMNFTARCGQACVGVGVCACDGINVHASVRPQMTAVAVNRAMRMVFLPVFVFCSTRAPLPKFVIHCGTFSHELRKQRGTSKQMVLVPLSI